uniref:C-type lectin domain-containing protein n=1 Tax=Sander lucioperca TaxID=283035 RepID=A0A8C9X7I7_SANLU
MENQVLKRLLNSIYRNSTLLGNEYDNNFTLLSAENTQLSVLLKNTLQENTQLKKTQLQVENKELNLVLKSTLEENGQLKLRLSESLHIITLAYAESNQLRLLLNNEQKTSLQLQEKNKLQFCKNDTLQCSRCMSGWTEHASRCFLLSKEIKKWEFGRRDCLDMGGDLAVVLNAEDQAFLTNMTFQYVRQNPTVDFHSAWIGLQDLVKEGDHIWINGERIQKNTIILEVSFGTSSTLFLTDKIIN